MNPISKDHLIVIIQKYVAWPLAHIQSMIDERNVQLIRSLKVDQLKKILKELVQNGYSNLHFYGNKAHLVESLHSFLGTFSPEDNLFHFHPNSGVPSSTPTPSSSYRSAPPAGFVTTPVARTASAQSFHPHLVAATYNVASSSNFLRQMAPASMNKKRHPSELTKQDLQIYNNLQEIEGITSEEILAALADCPTTQKSVDHVLMMIIERKQVSTGPPLPAPQSKEQEDADLDRAILESEKERDHIQERKRKRVATILEDPTLKILEATEFQKSVLLRGLPSHCHPDVSSSSSSSSSSTSVPTAMVEIMTKGCRLIRELSTMLDQHYEQKALDIIDLSTDEIHPSSPTHESDDHYFQLRQMLIRLLLIEFDALKYYGEVCYAYLLYLAEQLDQQYAYTYQNHFGCIHWYHKLSEKLQQEIFNTFQQLHQEFSKGLFKLVKDGEGVPSLFRKNYLKPYFTYISHRLDQDGFEIIAKEKQELIKFVEDISEVEDDDDDDNFDDDDYDD